MNVLLFASDQSVRAGEPLIAGTRVAIRDILDWLAAGDSVRQITNNHREVSEHAVRGAIQYAVLVLETQADERVRREALAKLVEMGYATDTEDEPPGRAKPPDMSVPTAYLGRAQGK